MKKTAYFLFTVMILSTFASCRKGPEDPLLSLTTRKQRISNTWEAYSHKINGIEKIEEEYTEEIPVNNCGKQTLHTKTDRSVIMTFSKKGDFSEYNSAQTRYVSSTTGTSEGCEVYNFDKTEFEEDSDVGKWNFTGGTGGTSRREQVFIYKEETKMGYVWDIIRLAKDELKLKRSYIKAGESTFTLEELAFYPKK